MASEAKDVGILAMDIYFPPNCVLQVPSRSRHLCFPARQIRIPLRPFPWIRRRRGHHRTRTHSPLFDSKARGQAAWTPTQHHHTLCVVPLRLRDLFTVAAGLGF